MKCTIILNQNIGMPIKITKENGHEDGITSYTLEQGVDSNFNVVDFTDKWLEDFIDGLKEFIDNINSGDVLKYHKNHEIDIKQIYVGYANHKVKVDTDKIPELISILRRLELIDLDFYEKAKNGCIENIPAMYKNY